MEVFTKTVDYSEVIAQNIISSHPLVPLLIKNNILGENCFIAGGAIIKAFIESGLLKQEHPDIGTMNIDIYCSYPHDALVIKILSLCDFEHRAVIKGDSIIRIFGKGLPEIQLILILKGQEVLEDFDLKCCQVLFDGRVKMAKGFSQVMNDGWKETLTARVSRNRTDKYRARGITFFGLKELDHDARQYELQRTVDEEEFMNHLEPLLWISFPLSIPGDWLEGHKALEQCPDKEITQEGLAFRKNNITYTNINHQEPRFSMIFSVGEEIRHPLLHKKARDFVCKCADQVEVNLWYFNYSDSADVRVRDWEKFKGKTCHLVFELEIIKSLERNICRAGTLIPEDVRYIVKHLCIGIRPL